MFEHSGGLVLGLANAARHRVRGYRTPRPFSPDELERSVDYSIVVARRWEQLVDTRDKRVLEIGPGPDLGTGAVLLASGARTYQAVDAFPLADRDLTAFYAALSRRIGSIEPARLSYTIATFPELAELSGEFDLVVSHATLEHIDDIPGLFRRLRELVPAGVMCHHVDAMTHMRFVRERDPLNILRFSEQTYRLMSFPGIPNRLRAGDYIDAAEAAGFRDVKILPGKIASPEYCASVRPHLPSQFAGRSDLDLLTFDVVTGVAERLETT